ncbi:MAG: FtsX-like permease family protein [Phycisphaerales bacterium]|nr:FtsX-like permease family protein [Phycisphaerales bacterium]
MIFSPYFYLQAIKLALSQIWANRKRSLLTALGIIVGVASTTSVIAALSGLKENVLTEFESFGANRLFVFPDRPDDKPRNLYPFHKIRIKPWEVTEIQASCPSLRAITPVTEFGVSVASDTKELEGITVVGIWPDWHAAENRKVIDGRMFSRIDEESQRQVCLLNEAAIDELRLTGGAVGTHILLDGRRFLVVGIVETIQSRMFGFGGETSEIFIPFSLAMKLQSSDPFIRITALAKSTELSEEARLEIQRTMRRIRGIQPGDPDTFRVEAIDQFIEQFKVLATGITAIAGGIVGISLLVGGIGIMNIMLVSVSERTREIGLRKAVGATPGAIMMQFLLEATVLCLAGGLVGVVIGKLFAIGLTFIPGAGLERADVPWWAVLLSFAFSAAVGVGFGFFPALKAAQLDPIEALRHE